jgi:hypothetical protein
VCELHPHQLQARSRCQSAVCMRDSALPARATAGSLDRAHIDSAIYMRDRGRALSMSAYELQARLRAHRHPTKVVYTTLCTQPLCVHTIPRVSKFSRARRCTGSRETLALVRQLFCCSELLCAFVLMTFLLHLFLGQEHESCSLVQIKSDLGVLFLCRGNECTKTERPVLRARLSLKKQRRVGVGDTERR